MDELAAIYDEHAKTCDETDFWGQVRRTVNGEPVSDHQIDLIVEEMSAALELNSKDTLLDICCGNGALSTRFFDQCAGGLGVDYSKTLIDIARKHFATLDVTYVEGEAVAYLKAAQQPERLSLIHI